jgi:rod shape-determining protein MreC
MFNKKRYLALALVAFVALVLLNLPANTSARLRLALSSQFLPLSGLERASQTVAGTSADYALSKSELIRQNDQLRRENAQLRIAAVQGSEMARENERLAQLVGWQRQKPWRLKLARVALRDPSNWWRTVRIDLGSRDGVKPNMPVLTPDGLVGRVASVGLADAQVVLIGDPSCRVAALLENDSRDAGVLLDASPLERDLVTLGYLPRTTTPKPGQNVVTSGLGGTFPRGIPIGKIVDSKAVESGLSVEARVKLAVPLGSLEEVWVLLP